MVDFIFIDSNPGNPSHVASSVGPGISVTYFTTVHCSIVVVFIIHVLSYFLNVVC